MDYQNLSDRLGSVSHFRKLPEADLKAIVNAGKMVRYPAGSTIFAEGEPSAGLYVLFEGQVNLSKLGLQGQECIMAVIRPVIMFNEVAVLDGGPNPVTAIAVQDSVLWRVPHDRFGLLMQRYPEVGTGLLRVLAARNRLLIAHYEDLLCRPIRARTAKVLLDLSTYAQRPISRRKHSNQELASRVATSPEAFSRSLKDLRESGVIECTRSHITVVSPERLAKLALIEPGMFKT